MNEPPGTIPRSTTPHPRRPPAHKSVSLRHSPPIREGSYAANKHTRPQPQLASLSPHTAPASDKANPPSSVSPNIVTNKHSSGESSDAGKWFENTNNNAAQSTANASYVDNDLPFFLRNSSSSDTPPDGMESRSAPLNQSTSMPYRPGLNRLGTDESSAEEFRSVIDDLTIANKKLKQKLRKYEKMYDAHLQDEKLFEVRFHGLPDHKKRELEETLRKFTADLDDGNRPPIADAPALNTQKTAASSHTSRFAESGYASMSASGQNSSHAPSCQESDGRKVSKSQYNRQQQSVRSYLHDIPAGLLPKANVPMTDKSKKKLVVRRLEQIFAGKRSAPGNHPQPMQQEEVAQSAAMADRQEREATGLRPQKEGLREARIMPGRSSDEDLSGHHVSSEQQPDSLQKLRPGLYISEHDHAGSGSPDQRPTRPLDLDLFRAQVPAENMEYIRHLGFSPPDMRSGDMPQDGHGWLYLNLLINMAQLHTINVTPDFVKHAVSDYSSKLELSQDGRKIRWKGGYDFSRNSDSSPDMLGGENSPSQGEASGSKSTLTSNSSGSSESMLDSDRNAAARAARQRHQQKFMYTPIFFHKEDSEDEDEYNIDMASSSNSPVLAQQRGDSSGFGSSAMRSSVMQSSSTRKRREAGPIIFYNKAKFCTDLSGDQFSLSVTDPASYNSLTSRPLGAASSKPAHPDRVVSSIGERRGPLHTAPTEVDFNHESQQTSSDEGIGFSPEDLRYDTGANTPATMEFEASGLGGVQPDDNFAIRVKRSHARANTSAVARHHKTRQMGRYPKKIIDALKQKSSEPRISPRRHAFIKEEILSASRRSLPSSTLPPASFLPFDSTSSGDVDSDSESDVSSGPSTSSSSDGDPASALQHLNLSPVHFNNEEPKELKDSKDSNESKDSKDSKGHESEESSSEDASDSDDSDDSVDLLAMARQVDPKTVRDSEREYDASIAERLAEVIPAGSSAATAGGGSGFNSPASVSAAMDEEGSLKKQSITSGSTSTRAKNLKRSRTSDSIATQLKTGKSRKMKKQASPHS